MFKELQPMLKRRAVLITVAVEGDKLRLNVIPKKLEKKIGEEEENAALNTPLTLLGTAEELDEKLPELLGSFVRENLTLEQQFAELAERTKQQLKDAEKASAQKVEDRKKNKSTTKSTTVPPSASSTASTAAPTPATPPAPPTPPKPVTSDLFSQPAAEAPKPAAEPAKQESAVAVEEPPEPGPLPVDEEDLEFDDGKEEE